MFDAKTAIKRCVRKCVNKLGYEIRKSSPSPVRQSISQSYALLSGLGFKPHTVVDVGVAEGTFELYREFPNSYFLLIEPLKEFEPNLKSILREYRGSYVLAAAGSENRQGVITIPTSFPEGASLLKEPMDDVRADMHERTIQIVRIDDIVEQEKVEGPYLIKADVHGVELDLLDGCPRALQNAEVVVLEVSMFEFKKGAPQFYDVVAYMKDHGFVAYDIHLALNRPLDGALAQIDIVFVKEYGPFRKDHSWRAF